MRFEIVLRVRHCGSVCICQSAPPLPLSQPRRQLVIALVFRIRCALPSASRTRAGSPTSDCRQPNPISPTNIIIGISLSSSVYAKIASGEATRIAQSKKIALYSRHLQFASLSSRPRQTSPESRGFGGGCNRNVARLEAASRSDRDEHRFHINGRYAAGFASGAAV